MKRFAPRCAAVLVVCTALLGVLTAFADDTDCPYHKMKWEDFKGPVPPNAENDAETAGGVKNSYDGKDSSQGSDGQWSSKLKGAKASSFMDKTRSWVKPDAKTDELLRHHPHLHASRPKERTKRSTLQNTYATGHTACKTALGRRINTPSTPPPLAPSR